ncbi:MAG: hypothetical protein ACI9U2_003670 [Bradymonadia bacterium]
MKDSDIIFEALYCALIEVRARGHETGDKVVWHLADLMHNLPGVLAQVARGERTYAEARASLEAKADQKGCRAWLDNIYSQIDRSEPESDPHV